MTPLSLEKDIILKRFNGIEEEIAEMQKLALLSFDEFASGVGFK